MANRRKKFIKKSQKSRGNSERVKDTEKKQFRSGSNDIAWYNKNPLLMKIASFVQQFLPLGRKLRLEQRSTVVSSHVHTYDAQPGFMGLYWLPTPGVSTDGSSEISKAAASIFERMREKNFSTNIWDIVDLAAYIFAWTQAFLYYGYLRLVYAYLQGYKFSNNYYPKGMSEALNIDRNDLLTHLAELEMQINIFTHIFERSRVPKMISIVARWLHMSAEVYKDADVSEKYQAYVFVPLCIGIYDATTGGYTQVDIGNSQTKLTFSNLSTIINQLTQALVYNDDFQIISADIEKYLGEESWKVTPLEPNTVMSPIYDPEMLWQIHNADFTVFDSAVDLLPKQVVVGTDTIFYWNPTFTVDVRKVGGFESKKIIDSRSDTMSSEEVVESTRLKAIYKAASIPTTGSGNVVYNIVKCGSEIITNAKVFYTEDDGVTISNFHFLQYVALDRASAGGITYWAIPIQSIGTAAGLNDVAKSLYYAGTFDYKPIQLVCDFDYSYNPGTFNLISVNGELDNYSVIEDSQLIALHEQCLLSEWDLQIAK